MALDRNSTKSDLLNEIGRLNALLEEQRERSVSNSEPALEASQAVVRLRDGEIEVLKRDLRTVEGQNDKNCERYILTRKKLERAETDLKRTEADFQRALGYIERVRDNERCTELTIVPKGHKVERVNMEPKGPSFDTYPTQYGRLQF